MMTPRITIIPNTYYVARETRNTRSGIYTDILKAIKDMDTYNKYAPSNNRYYVFDNDNEIVDTSMYRCMV